MVVEYLFSKENIQMLVISIRNIPSKILVMIPGPNSTDNGFPVRKTGSPTVTPARKTEISNRQSN